jgi:DNA-binding NtrC family response regulator
MARILIVDDEPGIRSLLTLAFHRAGYGVRTVASAAEAMTLCASEPFDALLTDVLMPAQTGHDLVRWVAAHYPTIHCALMTAFDVTCEDCPVQPRCPVLAKPFHPKAAVALVERMLNSGV